MLIKDIDYVFNNGSFLIYIYWYIILNYKNKYQVIIVLNKYNLFILKIIYLKLVPNILFIYFKLYVLVNLCIKL